MSGKIWFGAEKPITVEEYVFAVVEGIKICKRRVGVGELRSH